MLWTKNCVEPDRERNFEAGVAFRTGTTGGLSKNDGLWHKCEVPTGSENVCLSVKAGSDGRTV